MLSGVLIAMFATYLIPTKTLAAPPLPPISRAPTCKEFLEATPIAALGLSEEAKDRLQFLFEVNSAFAAYISRFFQAQISGEMATQVNNWLTPEARQNLFSYKTQDQKIEFMLRQAASLARDTESRMSAKQKKLKLVLEILSFSHAHEDIPDSDPFYQAMSFVMIDGKHRRYEDQIDLGKDTVLELLQLMENRISANEYGLDGLLKDPVIVEKMKDINRQYAQCSGGASIFLIPNH